MPVVPRNAVGGNIGGAWSNFEVTDVATGGTVSTSNSGFAGGGQISCHSHLSYSTALSQVPKVGKCPLGGNDDSQGDNDCQ